MSESENEYERVMVKKAPDNGVWNVKKMNYHPIKGGFSSKRKAVAFANQIARFVTVEE